jgi:photosystem II stability/assembly factor-like uncharacterized protein
MATLNPVTYDFVTPSVGWAVQDLNTPVAPAGGFSVFRTTDGARHWQRQLVLESSFVGFVPVSVLFVDQTHGFIGVGDPFQQLVRTSDGGRSWDSLPLPDGSASVDGIGFSNPDQGWLLIGGAVSKLYATSNGGTSWRRLPDSPTDASSLSYRSPTELWMGSSTTSPSPPHVYLSEDNGTTWTTVELPPPPGTAWSGDRFLPASLRLLPGGGVVAFIPPFDQPELVTFSRSLTSFDRGKT